ncbi:MAG TPA: carboxypeptidase regulatory-like domain-containing protein [Terriglobia bacterium]|nr:carboxypeptidase regulatory-like domain-containing protein [Terriglobia bacterium]
MAHLVIALLVALPLAAQSYRGTIRGVVEDASGGVVPGASVAAKNVATGESRSALTGTDGAYVIPELPAGRYQLTVDAKGFSSEVREAQVDVGADTTADFTLHVGPAGETVTVTAAPPLVETSRDVLGQVVENRLVNQLPLNGRDFGKLVALTPGVTVEGSGVAGTEKGFGQFNINGNRDRSNNYTVDGTDNNDPFFNNSALNQVGITGAPASLLPIDAIQEFNLQSQFGAEYGRNSGSVVNIITKSGGNELHGSAFEFVRNDRFDARNFFAAKKSEFRNNQFGGSLGGPIIRDRTFFFAAYEGQRERVGSDFDLLVPSAQAIATAQAAALSTGTISSINPALNKLLAFFPAPASVDPNTLIGSAPTAVGDKNDLDTFLAKIDHQFSPGESFSGRYVYSSSDQTYPLGSVGGFGSGSRLAPFAQESPTRVQVLSLSLLSTAGPAFVNEIRLGYSRYRTSFRSVDDQFNPASIGLNTGTGELGLPEFDFAGVFDNLGATIFGIPRGRTSQTGQLLDNVTLLRGRHTIKFGGELRRAEIASFNENFGRGLVSINSGNPTSGPDLGPAADVLANLYLGNVFTQANTGDTHRQTSANGVSFFAQDDFKARPNLTLNLGLRWEYFGPLQEAENRISNLTSAGTLSVVGTNGLNGAYGRDLNNFAPRLGFAWNAHGSTVVRGAYGIYFDYVPQNLLIANFTNSAGLTTNPIGIDAVLPLDTTNSTASLNGTSAAPIFGAPVTTGPFSIFVTDRNFETPYAQNWNLNIEQQLGQAASLEVGYVGSKGTKLTRLYDRNQDGQNPNYAAVDVLSTGASSTYNGLQVISRIRAWHGLAGFTAYTFSKSLDDASDGIDFNFATAAFPQNSDNIRAEHGPSTFDTRHRFTAAMNYQVPSLVHSHPRVGDGWQLNTIVTAQSGRPIPILTSSGGINGHQRPDLVAGVPVVLPNWTPSTGYLNPAAFRLPAGNFGDLGRDAVFGPKFVNVDFSLDKTTALTERVGLQFRWEIFNIFNHANFALPNGTLSFNADGTVAGPAGLITQTPDVAQGNPGLGGGGPRVMQLALRLVF